MINNLYIIDVSGCLYNYDFKKTHELNEQLLSGFLSAMTSFAQETFQTGLQTMGIRNGQKLVFYVDSEFKLLYTAIADARDNNYLLEKLLKEISNAFKTEKRSVLLSERLRSHLDEYRSFDDTLLKIVKYKFKDRNGKTLSLGLCGGLIFLWIIAIAMDKMLEFLYTIVNESISLLIFLIIFSGAVSVCCFISGFIAGNAKMGLFNGVLFFIFLNLIIALDKELYLNFLYIASYVFIACVAAGYAGGLICDRRILYPLK